MLRQLEEAGVVAIIRGKTHEQALKYIDASYRGGIRFLELTFTIPNVCELLLIVNKLYPNAVIGVGSVTTKEQAQEAIMNGAKYIISPGYVDEIVDICKEKNILYIPGCMTVTEMLGALKRNCTLIKLFPGDVFEPSYIRALKTPLPSLQIMPTGGVNLDNLQQWFENGAFCVGVGGSLFQSEDTEEIVEKVKIYVNKIRVIKGGVHA